MRRLVICVPAGNWAIHPPTAACTWSSAVAMSWFHSNVMDISALPRLVFERSERTPGTDRIASSTGMVTSVSMRSAERSPASTLTAMRGKSMFGKSETGNRRAAATPAATSKQTASATDRA